MENIEIKCETEEMKEAPAVTGGNNFYCCSKCLSEIEIISIDEEEIELKCNIHKNIKMKIKDYLNKMKENNCNKICSRICNIHKEEYLAFCFECKTHLCKECLKTGVHSYHYKINIIEIIPNNELLNKIINCIRDNRKTLINLSQVEIKQKNIINNKLNKNFNRIMDINNKYKEKNNELEKNDLKINCINYKMEKEK